MVVVVIVLAGAVLAAGTVLALLRLLLAVLVVMLAAPVVLRPTAKLGCLTTSLPGPNLRRSLRSLLDREPGSVPMIVLELVTRPQLLVPVALLPVR